METTHLKTEKKDWEIPTLILEDIDNTLFGPGFTNDGHTCASVS